MAFLLSGSSHERVYASGGYWMASLAAAPLYLTYKMYRTGVESEARQGVILEAAHDVGVPGLRLHVADVVEEIRAEERARGLLEEHAGVPGVREVGRVAVAEAAPAGREGLVVLEDAPLPPDYSVFGEVATTPSGPPSNAWI